MNSPHEVINPLGADRDLAIYVALGLQVGTDQPLFRGREVLYEGDLR